MVCARKSLLIAGLSLGAACTHHEPPKVVADETMTPSPARSLPAVKSGAPLAPAFVTVTLDAQTLFLDGAPIATRAADPAFGFDAHYKRSSADDLYIAPLGAAVLHARGGKDAGPGDSARLDYAGDVTYRELVEIAFTLGQNEVRSLRFVAPSAGGVVPAGTLAQIELFPPNAALARATNPPTLNLTVLLVDDGISVKARGGNVAPGCADVGPGLTIAKADGGGYSFADLAQCIARVKAAAPEFAAETSAVFTAKPNARYRDVLIAIDTLRGDHRDLFPNVQLGIAR